MTNQYPYGLSDDWRRSPDNLHHYLPIEVGGDPFASKEWFGVIVGDEDDGWLACRLKIIEDGEASCDVLDETEYSDIRDAMRVCEEHRANLSAAVMEERCVAD